jgi:cell division protease FtsH
MEPTDTKNEQIKGKKEPNVPNQNKKNKKPSDSSGGLTWIYIAIFMVLGTMFFRQFFPEVDNQEITRSDFDKMYIEGDVDHLETENEKLAKVFIKKESMGKERYKKIQVPVSINSQNQPLFYFKIYSNQSLEEHINQLRQQYNLPEINMIPSEVNNPWMGLISPIITTLLFVGLWYLIMRKMNGGGSGGGFPGGQIFSIGKSKATLFDENGEGQITFEQVAGLDEEKVEVMEIVNFLKEPQKYTNLGGKIPKGALLVGPPGTGKTLLAKAMAGEAKVPFFSISGSDFVEMFVGVGASRVRDLFKQAREKAPCIVFIDEIDAIGRSRNKSMVGGNDERESTLNQLLVEMDGFGTDKAVIMLAATNRPEILDDALLRPGRFDRQIHIDRPDLNGREQIFNVHLKPIKKGEDVHAKKLAELTPGFVGADIANICNEAALVAARKNKSSVDMIDFNEAIDRVTTGLEKKNMIIQPEEKKSIAYHEAGHALTSWYLEHAHPFVRVTIIPRSESLGHALYLPKEKYLTIKEELLDRISVSLGGRVAEDIVFGKISTGALSDLDNVTRIAYSMVTVYGMSDKVGNVSFYRMAENSYEKPYSEETSKIIDSEVRAIIDEQYHRTKELLLSKREELDKLANKLLEKEVLTKDDLIALFGKRPWDPDNEDEKTEATEEESSPKVDSTESHQESSDSEKEEIV